MLRSFNATGAEIVPSDCGSLVVLSGAYLSVS